MKKGNYQIVGRIHVLNDTIPIETPKGELLKRSMVLECPVSKAGWDRTNFMCFEAFNQATYQLDQYEVGDDVEVHFTIKSNQGKKDPSQWYTSLYIQDIYREFVKTNDRPEPSKKLESTPIDDLFAVKNNMPDTLLDERFNMIIEKPEPKKPDLFDMEYWPDKPDNIEPLPF